MGEPKQFLFQFRVIRLRSEMEYLVSDTTGFYKEATDEVPVLLSVFEVLLKLRPVLAYERWIMPKLQSVILAGVLMSLSTKKSCSSSSRLACLSVCRIAIWRCRRLLCPRVAGCSAMQHTCLQLFRRRGWYRALQVRYPVLEGFRNRSLVHIIVIVDDLDYLPCSCPMLPQLVS